MLKVPGPGPWALIHVQSILSHSISASLFLLSSNSSKHTRGCFLIKTIRTIWEKRFVHPLIFICTYFSFNQLLHWRWFFHLERLLLRHNKDTWSWCSVCRALFSENPSSASWAPQKGSLCPTHLCIPSGQSSEDPNVFLIMHYEGKSLIFSEWMKSGLLEVKGILILFEGLISPGVMFTLQDLVLNTNGCISRVNTIFETIMFIHLQPHLSPDHRLHVGLLTLKVLWRFPLFYFNRGLPQLSRTSCFSLEFLLSLFFSLEFLSGLSVQTSWSIPWSCLKFIPLASISPLIEPAKSSSNRMNRKPLAPSLSNMSYDSPCKIMPSAQCPILVSDVQPLKTMYSVSFLYSAKGPEDSAFQKTYTHRLLEC